MKRIAGLLACLPLALCGCGNGSSPDSKTPEQVQAETRAGIEANDAKLLTDPVAIKCRRYSGPAYDAERAILCRHFRLNPHVADASLDPASGEYDPTVDVLLKRGVTTAQTRVLAHRIKQYMASRYSGDRALIVREINIHHQASEDAEIADLSRVTGGKLGMVGAIVQNGMEDTDTAIDPKWHIEIGQRQVE